MNRQFLKAAVAGGDTRQVYLAEALGENGFLVKTYGLPKDPGHSQVKKASSLREALEDCRSYRRSRPFSETGKDPGAGVFYRFNREKFSKISEKGQSLLRRGNPGGLS